VNWFHKYEVLTNQTRHVRPPAWESAFTVGVTLGGIDDSTVDISIDLFSFMMNPVWKEHSLVKWLRDEWMLRTGSLDALGRVAVFEPPRVMYNPECIKTQNPSTPEPPNSTVQIEEVEDIEGEDLVLEFMEIGAELHAKRHRT
jgi:hypothetical protein